MGVNIQVRSLRMLTSDKTKAQIPLFLFQASVPLTIYPAHVSAELLNLFGPVIVNSPPPEILSGLVRWTPFCPSLSGSPPGRSTCKIWGGLKWQKRQTMVWVVRDTQTVVVLETLVTFQLFANWVILFVCFFI